MKTARSKRNHIIDISIRSCGRRGGSNAIASTVRIVVIGYHGNDFSLFILYCELTAGTDTLINYLF